MASYSFTNLIGAPYSGGKLVFLEDGNRLLYPLENRLCLTDLINSSSFTFKSENRRNILVVAVHPFSCYAISIDISGHGLVISLLKGSILNRVQFKGFTTIPHSKNPFNAIPIKENKNMVSDALFSPNGKYFAVAIERKLLIYKSPCKDDGWNMILLREILAHSLRILSIDWSSNSKYLLTASKDLTARLWRFSKKQKSDNNKPGFASSAFVEHRTTVVGVYFSSDMYRVYSVSKDGMIAVWLWTFNNEIQQNENENSKSAAKYIQMHQVLKNKKEKRKKHNSNISEEVNNNENVQSFSDGSFEYIEGAWSLELKAYSNQNKAFAKVCKTAFNKNVGILVVGYTNSSLSIYECPSMSTLHRLSVGFDIIDEISINSDGSWIAIANSKHSQLLVWEWRSETYILKQTSHDSGVKCIAFSSSMNRNVHIGSLAEKDVNSTFNQINDTSNINTGYKAVIATGGYDGKIKLWDSESAYSYAVFEAHYSTISDIVFTTQGNAIISASLDGTVRAFDLIRYKNFRTFSVANKNVQFLCVAVDDSGAICVAGGRGEEYASYVWNIQTSELLDVLQGHENSIVGLAFHPHPSKCGIIASASDNIIRIWDIYKRSRKGGSCETLKCFNEIVCMAFDPRGNNILAVSTLRGYITFWNVEEAEIKATIEGLRNIHSGRKKTDKFAANNTRLKNKESLFGLSCGVNANQHFSTICYSSNGLSLLAGSQTSARVCIYSTETYVLTNFFQLTQNRSLDGIFMELNSRYMTENGMSILEYNVSDSEEDDLFEDLVKYKRQKQYNSIPGVEQGELKGIEKKQVFSVFKLAFSGDARHWAAATSHGVFLYSLNSTNATVGCNGMLANRSIENFSPQILTKNVNIPTILNALKNENYTKAFILSLALNEFNTLLRVYEKIPLESIPLVVSSIHSSLLPVLLNFIRVVLTPNPEIGTRHLQYHLIWLQSCIIIHADLFQGEMMHFLHCDAGQQRKNESSTPNTYLLNYFERKVDLRNTLLLILREILFIQSSLNKVFRSNYHTLAYLHNSALLRKNDPVNEEEQSSNNYKSLDNGAKNEIKSDAMEKQVDKKLDECENKLNKINKRVNETTYENLNKTSFIKRKKRSVDVCSTATVPTIYTDKQKGEVINESRNKVKENLVLCKEETKEVKEKLQKKKKKL